MSEYRIGRLNGRFVVTWDDHGKRRRYRLDALTAKGAEAEAIDVIRAQTRTHRHRHRRHPMGSLPPALWALAPPPPP